MAALVSYVAVSRQLEQQANSNLQSAVNLVPSLVRFAAPGELSPTAFINFQLRTGDQVQVLIAENQGGPEVYSVDARRDTMPETTFFRVTPAAAQTLTSSSGATPVQTVQGADGAPYRVATVSVISGELSVQIGYPLTERGQLVDVPALDARAGRPGRGRRGRRAGLAGRADEHQAGRGTFQRR